MHEFSGVINEWVFICLHFLLFLVNFKLLNKNIMHPAVLFTLLWLIILLFHYIFSLTILNELFPISISTYLIFFIGALTFSFGAFVQSMIWHKRFLLRKKANETLIDPETVINLSLRYILVTIIVVGLPFYILAAYRVFLASNLENFFIGLRTELSYGDEDIGVVKYLFPFSIIVYTFSLYSWLRDKSALNKVLFIVSLIAVIIYTVFFTGRTPFLSILVLYLGMSYFYNEKFSLKKLSRLFIIFFIIFISIGIIYGKGGDAENSAQENVEPAAQTVAVYMVGGLNALDWEMSHQYRINYNGSNTLRFFIKIAETIHLSPTAKANDLFTPFVFVPYSTNVYTVYSPYIKDFGKMYAWTVIACLGFFQTFLYYKALEKKNMRYSLWYSFLLFPLFMSFFADQYFTLISYWIQIAVFIESILILNNLFTYKKW